MKSLFTANFIWRKIFARQIHCAWPSHAAILCSFSFHEERRKPNRVRQISLHENILQASQNLWKSQGSRITLEGVWGGGGCLCVCVCGDFCINAAGKQAQRRGCGGSDYFCCRNIHRTTYHMKQASGNTCPFSCQLMSLLGVPFNCAWAAWTRDLCHCAWAAWTWDLCHCA